MTQKLILIGSPSSSFVRKVRLAAATLRLNLTFQTEAQWSPDTRLGEMNPLGKVPVLLTPETEPLYDSRVILAYLQSLAGVSLRPTERLPAIEDQRIEALADGICDAVALTIVERWRAPERQSAVWTERQRAKVDAGVVALAADLKAERLPTEQVTCGGLAALCALEFVAFAIPDHPWRTEQPALQAWCTIWEALPKYDETKPVRVPGMKYPAL